MIISGILDIPWWGLLLTALALTHVTIAAVTLYLHRGQAHRACDFHPLVSHFFRLWLWLTTGMSTKEWVAIHRKHHAKVDTLEDPHSPQTHGLPKVLFGGVFLYMKEARIPATLQRYGNGTPDDWVERHLYTPYQKLGLLLMLVTDLALFGVVPGALIYVTQVAWIPFWAAGVINGVGHFVGYRNFDCEDASRNLSPWGILIGGEELHNNHHAHPTSARLSYHWHEFDLGWLYLRALQSVGLATVKKVAPRPSFVTTQARLGPTALQSILANRYTVMKEFSKLLRNASFDELDSSQAKGLRRLWMRMRSADLKPAESARIQDAIQTSPTLSRLAQFRTELCALWEDSSANEGQLVERLNTWCRRAEESGLQQLEMFSMRLRRYA